MHIINTITENLNLISARIYETDEGTFLFTFDPDEAIRMREFFKQSSVQAFCGGSYVPEQTFPMPSLGVTARGAFRVQDDVITSACMLVEPDHFHKNSRSTYSAGFWLSQWHRRDAEMPESAEELSVTLNRLSEQTRIRNKLWEEERAEYDRKEAQLKKF
jgi:hypothetical protein